MRHHRILVTGSFGGREISYDRFRPLRNDRADSAEKNRIGPIALGDDFWIVGTAVVAAPALRVAGSFDKPPDTASMQRLRASLSEDA